jgi:hypothetical protein
LHLQGVEVDEATVAAIGKLTGLEELGITFSALGDDKLSGLTGLKKLRVLRLNNTKVTDAGLLKLKSMKGLKELEVRVTPVTGTGAMALEKELPGCKVMK